jgi:hypothetical protein
LFGVFKGPWEWHYEDFALTFWIIELKKKRAFRKFSYRGIDLDQYVADGD